VKAKQSAIVRLDPLHPDEAFAQCRRAIAAGGVIAYPTDTFYGLGADPRNREAVRKLFNIKDRAADQPILLLIADSEDVSAWAAEITPTASAIMRGHWPGPVTLVFKAREDVLSELTAGTGTIGLRVPADERVRALLRAVGRTLTGTSANRSGMTSPRTAQEAADALGGRVDLVLDNGETSGGKPSTIIDVSGKEPRIIREGAVPAVDVLKCR
jgi:L-threonylcarbamoyladenylate synthase